VLLDLLLQGVGLGNGRIGVDGLELFGGEGCVVASVLQIGGESSLLRVMRMLVVCRSLLWAVVKMVRVVFEYGSAVLHIGVLVEVMPLPFHRVVQMLFMLVLVLVLVLVLMLMLQVGVVLVLVVIEMIAVVVVVVMILQFRPRGVRVRLLIQTFRRFFHFVYPTPTVRSSNRF
jgi:hypothetical protein